MLFKRKAKRIPVEQKSFSKQEPIHQKGFGTEMPPHKRLIEIYFDQRELGAQAAEFYSFYDHANWSSPKGTPYRNWKSLAANWIFDFQQQLKLKKRRRENSLY
jgi:hypothetical protein